MRTYLWGLIVVSCILVVFLLAPLTLHPSDRVVNTGDPLFYAWNLWHNSQSVFHGFRDLLDTNIFYPSTDTIAFSDTLFAQTIMTAPIIYITHNPILAENLYIFLTFPIAAVSMFLLSWYVTENSAASFLSGLFYAFSYTRLSQISHIPTLSSQWLPLVILFLLRYFDKGKIMDLTVSFLFFMLSLASTAYFGVFASIYCFCIAVAYGMYFFRKGQKKKLLDRLIKITYIIIPATILVFLVMFPYVRFKIEHPEVMRTMEESSHHGARFSDYITILPTGILAKTGLPTDTNEHVSFPTFTVYILSFIGIIIVPVRRKLLRFLFAAMGVISVMLSLGPHEPIVLFWHDFGYWYLPYFYLYKIFPVLQIVRVPARFDIFVLLSLSVLAAYGISALTAYIPRRNYTFFLIIFGLTFCTEIWQLNTPSVRIPTGDTIPAVYRWLSTQNQNDVIVELPLTPMDWGNPSGQQIYKTYDTLTDRDILANETYRVFFSAYHGKKMLNGYSGYFPETYYDTAYRMASFPEDYGMKLLKSRKVTYAIVHLWEYPQSKQKELQSLIARNSSLQYVVSFGDDYVYKILQ